MHRGDVVYANIPAPGGPAGHEQMGSRYAVIVQSDSGLASSSTIILVPTTSKLKSLFLPYTFQVEPSKENGFTVPTVILVGQLRAIDRRRVQDAAGKDQILGHLEAQYLQKMRDELRRLLEL